MAIKTLLTEKRGCAHDARAGTLTLQIVLQCRVRTPEKRGQAVVCLCCSMENDDDMPRFSFEFWAERAATLGRDSDTAAPKTSAATVCRFWLHGRCVAGTACKFRHVYIDAKVPLCKTVGTGLVCTGPCPFRHE